MEDIHIFELETIIQIQDLRRHNELFWSDELIVQYKLGILGAALTPIWTVRAGTFGQTYRTVHVGPNSVEQDGTT